MCVVLLPLCGLLLSVAAEEEVKQTAAPRPVVTATSSSGNWTHGGGVSGAPGPGGLAVDSSMIQRALYVLIAITMVGVLYFLIRAVRLKRPAHRKRKYGLLSNQDEVEMEAVESDEDDDTLYEARSLRR
ncbi:protein FAM174C [Nelusetta ayraudi]|uniref:protein FAM174C n=1 Tax=Nelusetta ayraudi TaxID=303726 RepID=UPI003F711816